MIWGQGGGSNHIPESVVCKVHGHHIQALEPSKPTKRAFPWRWWIQPCVYVHCTNSMNDWQNRMWVHVAEVRTHQLKEEWVHANMRNWHECKEVVDRFNKWMHMLWSNVQLPLQVANALPTCNDIQDCTETDWCRRGSSYGIHRSLIYRAFTYSNRSFVSDEDLCGWNVLSCSMLLHLSPTVDYVPQSANAT